MSVLRCVMSLARDWNDVVFFVKQKTAYDMRISDWSSDVCSSDLEGPRNRQGGSCEMKTLVWVEHDGKAVKDATLSAVTAAAKLGEVHLLVAGQGVAGVAAEAARLAGVGQDPVPADAASAPALAEKLAPLVPALKADHPPSVARAT